MKRVVFILVIALILGSGGTALAQTPVPTPTATSTPTPFWTRTPVATPMSTPVIAPTDIQSGFTSLQTLVDVMMGTASMAQVRFAEAAAALGNDFCVVIGILAGGESILGPYLTNTALFLAGVVLLVMVVRFILWVVSTVKGLLEFL